MTDNLRIWDAVSKTDPKHTKSFKRSGGFSGTAIKPIWLTKRLTEQFGPAGAGWGMEKPEFQTVAAPPDEILVFCTVALWYVDKGERGTVYGVGGDKVLSKNKYGAYTNDEAFKAAYTDALSNAMKQIGMGADIHMGLFEDQKYLREVEREFANGTAGNSNRALAEARADITAATGNSKSTYEVSKEKAAAKPAGNGKISVDEAKAKAGKWIDGAVSTLNLGDQHVDSLSKFLSENHDQLAWIESHFPELHEKFFTVYNLAAERARAKAMGA